MLMNDTAIGAVLDSTRTKPFHFCSEGRAQGIALGRRQPVRHVVKHQCVHFCPLRIPRHGVCGTDLVQERCHSLACMRCEALRIGRLELFPVE